MDDINVNSGPYGSSPHQAKQRLRVGNFLSIEANDHVMRLYPRLGSSTLSNYLLD